MFGSIICEAAGRLFHSPFPNTFACSYKAWRVKATDSQRVKKQTSPSFLLIVRIRLDIQRSRFILRQSADRVGLATLLKLD